MTQNRLQVTAVDNGSPKQTPVVNRSARRQEIQATMERLWLKDPEQFNPHRDAVQRKRISSTLAAISKQLTLNGKRCVDLGCGGGILARLLRDAGAKVDAVDIASNALDHLKSGDMKNITSIQDCLPATRLEDDAYDLVVCTETIGFLQPKEYRMLFAELSRLVNKEGSVACSSSLDINSENALERFAALAETEFEIDRWILRYDLLWIKCCCFFESPSIFIKASEDQPQRNIELAKKKSLSGFWFKMNTTKAAALFWRGVNLVAHPVASGLRQSSYVADFFEKITKFIWDESGISHALFIGKRRPLTFPLPKNEIPIEPKHKRQVWE